MKYYFKIPTPMNSINKTIRFPINVVEDVEDLIKGTNCTFSAFVIEAVKSAVNYIKDK